MRGLWAILSDLGSLLAVFWLKVIKHDDVRASRGSFTSLDKSQEHWRKAFRVGMVRYAESST